MQGHVNAFFQESTGEEAPSSTLAGGGTLVVRFAPDVRMVAQAMVLTEKGELLIGQHAEWRDNVFFKILVLIIASDQDKVRPKGINFSRISPVRLLNTRACGRRDVMPSSPPHCWGGLASWRGFGDGAGTHVDLSGACGKQ